MLGLLLQPTTFNTVMLMLPVLAEPGWSQCECTPSSTQLMKACKNPTTVTWLLTDEKLVSSIIGIVTIELLVETRFPDSAPLPALISTGPRGQADLLSVSWPFPDPFPVE